MKAFLIVATSLCSLLAAAQGYPFIGQPTITPLPAQSGQPVRIVTHVITPNLGKSLSKNWSANPVTKTISIDLCKWSGMFTAIQEYRDTFDIPSLAPGNWTVLINYTISSSDVACQTQTAASAAHTMQVNTVTTAVGETHPDSPVLFPNPASEIVYVSKATVNSLISVFNALGACVMREERYDPENGIHVSELHGGLYFVKIAGDFCAVTRLVVR